MPSIFIVKEKIENPKEWYDNVMSNQDGWEYDNNLNKYHTQNVYLLERADETAFEDMSEEKFFGWDTQSWITVAGEKELVYGYYNDSMREAEFIQVKNGKCIREYRVYDGETDTDE
ncbi:MAG: hypothetical protein IJ379_13330, partial [Lachnospiraceae bacterium]|nr:hypothetical protein [Lachnospiraceae bacterium]